MMTSDSEYDSSSSYNADDYSDCRDYPTSTFSKSVCSPCSSLTTDVTPSVVTRGPKGAYYTAHTRKRVRKSEDPRYEFNALFKDELQASSFLQEFKAAVERNDAEKQDAIIGASILMGASARLLEKVFNVGWRRYKRIRDNRAKQVWFYYSILLGNDSLLY
jgi:hypothetical protein